MNSLSILQLYFSCAYPVRQMQQKLEALEREKYEPIAVIGMGCRFPGADNPEAFWQLLTNRTDAITEVPPEHWHAWQYYDRNPDMPGKICTVKGGFVSHLKEFDASFFRISPREAVSLESPTAFIIRSQLGSSEKMQQLIQIL